jgi:hypothetical protein
MTQGKVTITATATKILDANTQRRSFWLQNVGSKSVHIGYNSSVTTNTPKLFATGSYDRELSRDYRGEIWGICATGETSDIAYLDL